MTITLWRRWLCGILLFAWLPLAGAADYCSDAILKEGMAWCLDPGSALSDYQKTGRDEMIEGHFCKKGGLIADGFLICMGHDPQHIANGYECRQATYLKVAAQLLKDDDPRRPGKCK